MQPTYYPEWATTDVTLPVAGTSNKVRPDSVLREVGYDLAQQPACEEWNYQFNNIWQWIVYLNEESLAANTIGVGVGNVSGVIDVRDSFQNLTNNETDSFTITDLTTHIELSAPYSASAVLGVESDNPIYYDGEAGILSFEVKAEDVNTYTDVNFYFSINGTRKGVAVLPGTGAETYPAAGPVDGTFLFVDGEYIQLKLNLSTGDIESSLNGVDFGNVGAFGAIPTDAEIQWGLQFNAAGADNVTMQAKYKHSHTLDSNLVGLLDMDLNPYLTEVVGVDVLDSRKVSVATKQRNGVVKLATPNEINDATASSTSDSVLTVKDFHKYMDSLLLGSFKEVSWDAPDSNGYVHADGRTLSRTDYAAYFAVVGTRYGVGDGSTTFNIPDARGLFLRGWDDGAGIDPDAGTRTDSGDGTTGDNIGTNQGGAANRLHSVQNDIASEMAPTTTPRGVAVLPTDGSWSDPRRTDDGTDGAGGPWMRLKLTGDENRPVNMSTKIMIYVGRV